MLSVIALELCPSCLLNAEMQSTFEFRIVKLVPLCLRSCTRKSFNQAFLNASLCQLRVVDSDSAFFLSLTAGKIQASGLPCSVPSTLAYLALRIAMT